MTVKEHYQNIKKYAHKEYIPILVLVLLVLLKRILISNYGINREAPIELENIFLVLDGQLIYKDFFWYHGFFPIYWHALIFKLFSPQIYYLRLFVTFFALTTSYFAYLIARKLLSPWKAAGAALLAFTGLLIPEHATGEMMAFCFITISLFFFTQYCEKPRTQFIYLAGFSSGMVSLAQVLPLGIVSLFGGLFTVIGYGFFRKMGYFKNLAAFLIGYFPVLLISYGSLSIFVPLDKLLRNLFPLFFGYDLSPNVYKSLPFPSLFPSIWEGESLTEIIQITNKYLISDFRWWLIIAVFIWGLVEFFRTWKTESIPQNKIYILGTLVLYSPLFESKFLSYLGRLGTVPNYINMLPTFILLIYLLESKGSLKRFSTTTLALLISLFFLYPLGKYYNYFSKNAVPLDLPYTKGIEVSPYKYELYQKTLNYIQENTSDKDTIVFAGINRYFSIISGRYDVFRNNILTFAQATFYPSRKISGFLEESFFIEENIVKKIEKHQPKLILLPKNFLQFAEIKDSPFLKFLELEWELVASFGDETKKNYYEYESPVSIYAKKKNKNLG
jgi:hypothetical protein